MAGIVKIIESPKFDLIRKDLQSLATGLGITLLGAALTYLTEYITKGDFGAYTPLIVAVWALVVNIVRKYISETEYIK